MALISTQSITDGFGNIHENAIGVIDQCNGNKKEKQQMFVFEVYRSLLDRQNGIKPFLQDTIVVSGEEFDNWFSPQAIINNGGNQYATAYKYLLQLKVENATTENSEIITSENFKYSGWILVEESEDTAIDFVPVIVPGWNGLAKKVLGGDLLSLFTRVTAEAINSNPISIARNDINLAVTVIKDENALAASLKLLQQCGFVFTDEEKQLWNNVIEELGFSSVVQI